MKRIQARWTALAAFLVLGAGGNTRGAENESPPHAPLLAVSTQFQSAVQDLSSENFRQRNKAVGVLEQATIELASALVTNTDGEAQLRAADVMRFNAGLSLWLQATLTQASETRDAAITWGLKPEHARWAALAYSPSPESRAQAARKLPEFSEPPARALEAILLEDPDRDVHLAAMDAVWDHEATQEAVDALWNSAIAMPIEIYRTHRLAKTDKSLKPPAFRGEPLSPTVVYTPQNQDSPIATRVLIHFHSPLVAQQVDALLKQAAASPKDLNAGNLFPTGYAPMNFKMLLDAYKDKSMVPSLYALAIGEPGSQMGSMPHRTPFYSTSRLYALAMVLSLTGQQFDAYGLRSAPEVPNSWVVDSADAEALAINQLKKWWSIHSVDYGNSHPSSAP